MYSQNSNGSFQAGQQKSPAQQLLERVQRQAALHQPQTHPLVAAYKEMRESANKVSASNGFLQAWPMPQNGAFQNMHPVAAYNPMQQSGNFQPMHPAQGPITPIPAFQPMMPPQTVNTGFGGAPAGKAHPVTITVDEDDEDDDVWKGIGNANAGKPASGSGASKKRGIASILGEVVTTALTGALGLMTSPTPPMNPYQQMQAMGGGYAGFPQQQAAAGGFPQQPAMASAPQQVQPPAKKSKFQLQPLPQAAPQPQQAVLTPNVDKDTWLAVMSMVQIMETGEKYLSSDTDLINRITSTRPDLIMHLTKQNKIKKPFAKEIIDAHKANWGYPAFALLIVPSDKQVSITMTTLDKQTKKLYREFMEDMGFPPGFAGEQAPIDAAKAHFGIP